MLTMGSALAARVCIRAVSLSPAEFFRFLCIAFFLILSSFWPPFFEMLWLKSFFFRWLNTDCKYCYVLRRYSAYLPLSFGQLGETRVYSTFVFRDVRYFPRCIGDNALAMGAFIKIIANNPREFYLRNGSRNYFADVSELVYQHRLSDKRADAVKALFYRHQYHILRVIHHFRDTHQK